LEEEMRLISTRRNVILSAVTAALFGLAAHSHAAVVTVNAATMTDGYMSWTPEPGNTVGGAGASGWGISDLAASFDGPGTTVTLSPNTNISTSAAGSTYWFIGGNTNVPGQQMDANLYNETDNITDLNWTFNYNVLSNSFVMPPMVKSDAFIKAFAPGYAYIGEVSAALTPGLGSLTLNPSTPGFSGLANGDIIQYGFETVGPDLTTTTAALAGTAVVTAVPVPEPTTIGLAGAGVVALLARRRRA
jgi:hypothetical protein